MIVQDLGKMPYRTAWTEQELAHAQVLAGGPERLLIVEHPPVITLGRRPGLEKHLLVDEATLIQRGVEVVQSDRGGDITFHGPGQLVAYPIIRLIDHGLSVSGYVHRLEQTIIATLETFGIQAGVDKTAVGVWVNHGNSLAKIAALGVRIRRGTTLHGLALNVETDLSYFDLIVPCGLVGRPVTSMRQLLSEKTPSMETVKAELIRQMQAWRQG